ncbi:MAG: hypothetical protein AB1505_33425 [Candidatus Latescibacterota bacterium]
MARPKAGKRRSGGPAAQTPPPFTARQAEYLAYIHLFRKLHRFSPSEVEIARYFRVSAPAVHQMLAKLEESGLITREPGVPRSVRLAIPASQVPALPDAEDAHEVGGWVAAARTPGRPARLYTLQVFLVGGPVPDEFRGKVVSRKIQIRGDQRLADLHQGIFRAYDRWDEHMYEFQLGGRGPQDPAARRYGLPAMLGPEHAEPGFSGDVYRMRIDSLGLKVGHSFGYWFDYGDDWWHQINVVAIDEKVPRGRFPRIVERVGESPPQYPDAEEEEEEA